MPLRSLPVLLQIIDAEPTDPFMSDRIVDAYQAGVITNAEARHLQSFERRSPKSRKRALADVVDVSPEAIADMRSKLAAMRERLDARDPRQRGDDVA